MTDCFVGIDVGTGSVRAGVFDRSGTMLGSTKHPIRLWQAEGEIVEQSSADIWAAVCSATREALAASGVDPASIKGIGVDATCSLVAVTEVGEPVAVGPSGDPGRNVIVWMDHRAMDQTQRINATRHGVLDYVGGQISPEMETPKLLWLLEHQPDDFARAGHFFDLSDFLTWRLTGSLQRSVCTVTCKWTYLAHEQRWDESYFRQVGLGVLADEGFRRIGTEVVDAGTPLGTGLTSEAAAALGLLPGTPVGAALIDAHAGGVGTIGSDGSGGTLAYIFGTSACAMAATPGPVFVPGIWGPYFAAMIPGMWLNEAGQSAAGAAIDLLVEMHPASSEAKALAANDGVSLVAWLDRQAQEGLADFSSAALRAADLHVLPEFLGNRSPFADPQARAVISGLGADTSLANLVELYLAGLCGLGYGLAQIIAALSAKNVPIAQIVVSGGAAQSRLVRQIIADATGTVVTVPQASEPVLLGAAMLGAAASGSMGGLSQVMTKMSGIAQSHQPAGGAIAAFHRRKAEVYALLQEMERRQRAVMHG